MKKGTFIGLACLDIKFYGKEKLFDNKKIKTNNYILDVGGPATNAAVTYSLLGGNATLVTCIGNSNLGDFIKKKLKSYNIDVIDMYSGTNEPSIASIYINDEGERSVISGQQVYYDNNIKSNDTLKGIKNSDFYFFDCNVQEISLDILDDLDSNNIVLDLGSWKNNIEKFMNKANIAIASADCIPPNSTIFEVAKKNDIEEFAVTYGEDPIKWFNNKESGSIDIEKIKAVDTLGAGDVLHGAFCYYYYNEGLDFEKALINSSKVATYKSKIYGVSDAIIDFKNNQKA